MIEFTHDYLVRMVQLIAEELSECADDCVPNSVENMDSLDIHINIPRDVAPSITYRTEHESTRAKIDAE